MKLKSIALRNFRCFENEQIFLDRYNAFIGENNCGKSAILQAVNIFYGANPKAIGITKDDFRVGTKKLRITLTWDELNTAANDALGHYARGDELSFFISANLESDGSLAAQIQGSRLGIKAFGEFFATEGAALKKDVYSGLRATFPSLPELTKGAAISIYEAALRSFEAENIPLCEPIESEANAFGATGPMAIVKRYCDWVYIPAVKDASEEAKEARNTAMGILANRIIRSRVNIQEKLEAIKGAAKQQIEELSNSYKSEAQELEKSLNRSFRDLTSTDANVHIDWSEIDDKSVAINPPVVKAEFSDDIFRGDISKFGHGLQRNYLFALVTLNAKLEVENQPSTIIGFEEPELFQHPPQARHLFSALRKLSDSEQILVTTHSPLFISASAFPSVRRVHRPRKSNSSVYSWSVDQHRNLIAQAKGEAALPEAAAIVALESLIGSDVSEALFCKRLVMVEGAEDRALGHRLIKPQPDA